MKANGLDLVRDFVVNEREGEGETQEKTSVKTKWPAFLLGRPVGVYGSRQANPGKRPSQC